MPYQHGMSLAHLPLNRWKYKVLYVTMKAGSLAGSHVRWGWDGSPGVTWNSRCPSSLERSLGEYSFSPWRCSVVADAWKPGDLEAVSLKKTGCLVRKVVKCDQKEEVIWISGPFIGRSSWPSIIDFFGVFSHFASCCWMPIANGNLHPTSWYVSYVSPMDQPAQQWNEYQVWMEHFTRLWCTSGIQISTRFQMITWYHLPEKTSLQISNGSQVVVYWDLVRVHQALKQNDWQFIFLLMQTPWFWYLTWSPGKKTKWNHRVDSCRCTIRPWRVHGTWVRLTLLSRRAREKGRKEDSDSWGFHKKGRCFDMFWTSQWILNMIFDLEEDQSMQQHFSCIHCKQSPFWVCSTRWRRLDQQCTQKDLFLYSWSLEIKHCRDTVHSCLGLLALGQLIHDTHSVAARPGKSVFWCSFLFLYPTNTTQVNRPVHELAIATWDIVYGWVQAVREFSFDKLSLLVITQTYHWYAACPLIHTKWVSHPVLSAHKNWSK